MARRSRKLPLVLAPLVALVLAACGSATSGGSGSGTADVAAGSGTADVAAAESIIEPYLRQPSDFPITEKLQKSAEGKRIAYMDCGTQICGLFFSLIEPAADAAGMSLTRIKSGNTADTIAQGFDTVLSDSFDGVFVPGLAPALWQRYLDEFEAKGIPVVTSGVTGGDISKIDVAQVSDKNAQEAGKLLAAYVVAQNGADANVAFYLTPEITFTNLLAESFEKELLALCAGCEVRAVKIPVATLGNRATSLVVDDLQAHPDTKTAVFSVGEQANGFGATLKTAGLEVEAISNSPTPDTLAQIQSGTFAAALGLDLTAIAWTAVDSLARLSTGQEADPGATADIPPMQFLTKENLPEDVTRGWTGYPDIAERFAALWKDAF